MTSVMGGRHHSTMPVGDRDAVDVGDWIEWGGGICPLPVETLIMTRLRNGWESSVPAMAGYHRWDHGRTPDSFLFVNDIIAYRRAAITPENPS